ncbi:hypothetical protein Q4575_05365 [Psychrosphaera sp. 1_MG-2023]|uniref:hypothetical protein n=1 Tax=Psychrosphaera sp. 1_MG-2023 TaxID=3062643 RepID=UPI0026E34B0D|nr:hypothetical protein [Psychrosphaera sp. 1_MG-2023]MDO6718819.1 hypothetical protein [Psychrosphaera sp. 1_MG-2023]
MGKLTKDITYSVNGFTVETFKAGEYDELPQGVINSAKAKEALEGEIKAIKVDVQSKDESPELIEQIKVLAGANADLEAALKASQDENSKLVKKVAALEKKVKG